MRLTICFICILSFTGFCFEDWIRDPIASVTCLVPLLIALFFVKNSILGETYCDDRTGFWLVFVVI